MGVIVPAKSASQLGPLSRWELDCAVAAFSGLFPRGAHPAQPVGIADVDARGALQVLLREAPARAVLGIRAAILICALAPLVVLRRFRTIVGVDPAARSRVMAALLSSSLYPVRQLALLLKMMASLVFACVPEVRRAILQGARNVPPPADSGTRLIGEAALVRRKGAADGRRIA